MTVPGQTIINQWREVGERAVRKFKTRPKEIGKTSEETLNLRKVKKSSVEKSSEIRQFKDEKNFKMET